MQTVHYLYCIMIKDDSIIFPLNIYSLCFWRLYINISLKNCLLCHFLFIHLRWLTSSLILGLITQLSLAKAEHHIAVAMRTVQKWWRTFILARQGSIFMWLFSRRCINSFSIFCWIPSKLGSLDSETEGCRKQIREMERKTSHIISFDLSMAWFQLRTPLNVLI